ncbi:NUDIX hydrolase [Aestuariispira ectoiniformans]|uniref:NUDIX hydrolase n=1 Tax=Aestuariispira ectoiniformans TaxID=2775080 RepID=UPI00223BE5C8|nr:hypothetical protein [Aestuariispira ectoiniformans]
MSQQVIVGLNVVVVALVAETPCVMTVRQFTDIATEPTVGLPFGPLDTERHRTLEEGLRAWVQEVAKQPLGYVEQLYTFGDRDRHQSAFTDGGRVISVCYLALTRAAGQVAGNATWESWYDYLPWEDWRAGEPPMLRAQILPALTGWVDAASTADGKAKRQHRMDEVFGLASDVWDSDRALDRYELLYEAGLVEEAWRDRGEAIPSNLALVPGKVMAYDHRRILATAMGRLRGKVKFRPVVFELLPEKFTLLQLQRCVEALAGKRLHKQNFRRLIEAQGLVEETGEIFAEGRGRPAKLYRFRREVLRERLRPGVKHGY